MFQLVYISKARIDLTKQDIENILAHARNNNVHNNISGCLLYFDHQFVQILEGGKSEVEELYEKIRIDDRHQEVLKTFSEISDNRSFSAWSMYYHELSEYEMKSLSEKLFVDNLSSLFYMVSKPTYSVKLFWEHVKKIIEK